jgi:hypothetical protein
MMIVLSSVPTRGVPGIQEPMLSDVNGVEREWC